MLTNMTSSSPINLQAEQLLTDAGVHLTAIRLAVMREIMQHDGAFTLADLEAWMDTMDKSTLFRTLTLFLRHRILHEVDNGSGSKLYCRCTRPGIPHSSHIHFTCTSCGRTFCIKDIDGSQIPRPAHFEVQEINCVMKGLCPECLQRRRIS